VTVTPVVLTPSLSKKASHNQAKNIFSPQLPETKPFGDLPAHFAEPRPPSNGILKPVRGDSILPAPIFLAARVFEALALSCLKT
jgi:hypothetical protein